MTDERCQQYLEDPEANAAHLQECLACRTLAATLDPSYPLEEGVPSPGQYAGQAGASVPPLEIDVDALPLALWEGATHRPWPLVVSLVAGVFLLAIAVCFAAGTSITSAVTSGTGSFEMIRDLVRMTGEAAPHAPAGWQVFVLIGFFVVNGLLVILLRRAPRGIDA
jgi:hypothetical protein